MNSMAPVMRRRLARVPLETRRRLSPLTVRSHPNSVIFLSISAVKLRGSQFRLLRVERLRSD